MNGIFMHSSTHSLRVWHAVQVKWTAGNRARGRVRTCQPLGEAACFQQSAIGFFPFPGGSSVFLQFFGGRDVFAGVATMDGVVLARRCPVVAGSDLRMTVSRKLGRKVQTSQRAHVLSQGEPAHGTGAKGTQPTCRCVC